MGSIHIAWIPSGVRMVRSTLWWPTGLLVEGLNEASIIQKPGCSLNLLDMVIQKFLDRNPVSCAGLDKLER